MLDQALKTNGFPLHEKSDFRFSLY